jgi:hypothetical protein
LLESGSVHEVVGAASLQLSETHGDEDDKGRDGKGVPPEGGGHLVGNLVGPTVRMEWVS